MAQRNYYVYVSGDLAIERGEWGIQHGMGWALWDSAAKTVILSGATTLRQLQRHALATRGTPLDSWRRIPETPVSFVEVSS